MDAKKVLIIDDEEVCCDIFSQILKFAGFDTFSKKSGQDGLDCANKITPSAIILDIALKDVNGVDLAREIRKTLPSVPLLFVTGFENEELKEKISQFSNAKMLQKPILSGQLIFEINNLIHNLEEGIIKTQENHTSSGLSAGNSYSMYTLLDFWLHEMVAPLNNILGFSELLEEQLTEEKPRRFVQNIFQSARRLNVLIREIILLAKLENGEIKPDFQQVHRNQFIKICLDTNWQKLEKEGYKIHREIEFREPRLNVDIKYLEQTFDILFSYLRNVAPDPDISFSLATTNNEMVLKITYRNPKMPLPSMTILYVQNVADILPEKDKDGILKLMVIHRMLKAQKGKFWWGITPDGGNHLSFLFPVME